MGVTARRTGCFWEVQCRSGVGVFLCSSESPGTSNPANAGSGFCEVDPGCQTPPEGFGNGDILPAGGKGDTRPWDNAHETSGFSHPLSFLGRSGVWPLLVRCVAFRGEAQPPAQLSGSGAGTGPGMLDLARPPARQLWCQGYFMGCVSGVGTGSATSERLSPNELRETNPMKCTGSPSSALFSFERRCPARGPGACQRTCGSYRLCPAFQRQDCARPAGLRG